MKKFLNILIVNVLLKIINNRLLLLMHLRYKSVSYLLGICICFNIFSIIYTNSIYAQNIETVVYENKEPCGPRMKMQNGKFSSILSCGEANLASTNNPASIRNAKKRATLRAKAEIVKFISETITTTETLETISRTLGKNGDFEEVSLSTQIESIQSEASKLLKGVQTIGEDVDKENMLVQVWVGINLKTMKAADSLKYSLEKDFATQEKKYDAYRNSQEECYDVSGCKIKKRSKDFDEF